jgi:hypothetical protein
MALACGKRRSCAPSQDVDAAGRLEFDDGTTPTDEWRLLPVAIAITVVLVLVASHVWRWGWFA